MSSGNRLLHFFFGKPEDNSLEDQIPMVLSFTTATLSLLAMTVNIVLQLPVIMIFIPLLSSLSMYFVYYKIRYSSNKLLYKILMVLVAFTYFNFLWFYNFASHGPNLYLFILFFIFIVLIFESKIRLWLSILLVTNILVLFYIEYFHNDLIARYEDNATRIFDIYLSFLIYLTFTFVMTLTIRYYYLLERSKAKRSDQLKSAFLSNMSHEIRTPMSAILGFSKLLDYTESDSERNEYVAIINDNGKMLMQLLDDIIDISRMDSGQFDIYKQGFILNVVMEELRKVIQLNLDQQNKTDVKLNLEIKSDGITVFTDETRLRQILFNLLSNAAKFTLKGNISFGYTVEGRTVSFFVKDTGIGIKNEYKGEIFNRFYKVENAEYQTLPRGSGIGLSIVKLLVEKLGGQIRFESEYGKGSTFSFNLPEILLAELPSPKPAKSAVVSFNPGSLILVVEDDDSNMLLIISMLRRLKLEFIQAGSGHEAIDKFAKNERINLVLLDLNLPGMSGYDVIGHLKALNPNVPVVALTAYAMSADIEKAMNLGFNDYLTKPAYQHVLSECLAKHIPVSG